MDPPFRNYTNNQFVPFIRTNTSSPKVKIYDFFVNDNQKNIATYAHKNNYISTTKYSIYSFIPKSIFVQFMRLSNVYFLFTAIIQSIPIITPLSNITAIVPLVFVLLISIIRELIEDLGRYSYDKQSNNEKVIVYRKDCFVESRSEMLRVGELIYVKDDSFVPADMLLIDSGLSGLCYLRTSSIDGEKVLKEKTANKNIAGIFSNKHESFSPKDIEKLNLKGFCQSDYPNPELTHIEGKISLAIDEIEVNISIDNKQMVLKGSVVKSTGWIIGIVLYTGLNNKIIQNSKKPHLKMSKIEHKINKLLFVVLVLQITLCAGCAVYNSSQYENTKEYYGEFLDYSGDIKLDSFLSFFTYMLLLNTLIPISLIVTLEIVKIIQGLFIRWDIELYSMVRKRFCKPLNVSLNEELGNVNYVFTDKTGTLTSNKMEFKYCVIGNTCYKYIKNKDIYLETEVNNNNLKDSVANLTPVQQIRIHSRKSQNQFHLNKPITQLSLHKNKTNNNIIPFKKKHFSVYIHTDQDDQSKLLKQDLVTIHEFWQALACCHECICSDGMDGIEYFGVSPDDVELVKAAHDQGYSFQKSSPNIRRIIIGNCEKEMKILKILSFTSTRRRMSIIVEDSDQIKMYIKGADVEIRSRLSSKSKVNYFNTTLHHVNSFSSKGLRTLMVAYKILSFEEYTEWNNNLEENEMNLEKRTIMKQELYEKMEKDFLLLGATVVEDKLQKNVPETIRDLQFAGIKIWMLTGDKVDTAENIALSCNLINKAQKLFKISSNKETNSFEKSHSFFAELEQFIIDFHAFANFDDDNFWYLNSSQSEGNFSARKKLSANPFNIIIEGAILGPILRNENIKSQFLKIALCAQTVICCRVSPLQKSLTVKKVKEFDHGSTILSIGDGGNDVSMIIEGHIGVGVYGEEGLRAVQASDYAIGEFSLLRRLLFFHGRNNSDRISHMILYFFYKNFFFSIIHFFYCFYSLGSGQTIIDDWFIAGFNLIFTALPLGVQAVIDLDLVESDGSIIKDIMPLLYLENRESPLFSYLHFTIFITKGSVLGAINFYIVKMASSEGSIDSEGNDANLWYCSVLLFTNIIVSVSITLLVTQKYMTVFLPLIMLITTFGLYSLFVFIVHNSESFKSYGTMLVAFQAPNFYLTLLLICIIGFVVDYALHSCRYLVINNLNTRLMLLKSCNKLNESSLPEVIAKAKQNLDVIDKYNNYNTVANTSLSCSQVNFPQKLDDIIGLNHKKRKNIKQTLEPPSTFHLKKLENPFNRQISKHTIFKLSSFERKTNSNKNIKQKALETRYPSMDKNPNEELRTKERNLSSNAKIAPNNHNSLVLKNSMDGLNN